MKPVYASFWASILVSLLWCFSTPGSAMAHDFLTEEEHAWLEEHRGRIDILTGYSAPPNAYINEYGEYEGFLVDVLHEIEDVLDFEFTARVFATWDELVEYSKTGDQFIIVGIAQTDARSEYLTFTDSFVKVPYVMVTQRSSPLETMGDLDGADVCTVANYAVNDFLAWQYPHISPIPVMDNLEGLRAVSTGQCGALITNQMYASHLIQEQGLSNLHIAGDSGYLNRLSAATAREDHMLFSILDKAMDQIPHARMHELYQQWVGGESGVSDATLAQLGWGLAVLGVLIIASWFWVWTLRRSVRLVRQSLRQSEAKHSVYVESSPMAMFIADGKGRYVDVNTAACRLVGFEREELLHMSIPDLSASPVEFDSPATPSFARLKETGRLQTETILRCKDGGQVAVMLDAVRLSGNRFMAFCQDITPRRAAENALAKSEERMALALESVRDAVWDWHVDTGEVYFSPRWYTMLGYAPYEMPQEFDTWSSLLHPEDVSKTMEILTSHMESGQPFQMEFRLRNKAGQWQWILDRGRVVEKDEQGKAKRLLGTHMDIAERKQIEDELTEAKVAAETANKAKSEFLANMSHEIRTPLNGILGMLQLMKSSPPRESHNEYVETAIQSGKRLTTLLSDILDLSLVEAGGLNITARPFSLAESLDTLSQLFCPSAEQKGVCLDITSDPLIPEPLLGDSTRLMQVLGNLMGNAIKFTDRGSVSLSAHVVPDRHHSRPGVLFSVADTGIGIDETLLERLFEAFSQAENSYSRSYQGAGLGLAITKQLVALMGGAMCVESSLGQGATFHVFLPLAKAPGQAAAVAAPKATLKQTGLDILLVEDDQVNRFTMAKMLEKLGHRAKTAVHGEQALDMMRESSFHLVLMDVQLPVMNGMEATRAIRQGQAGEHNRNLPVVAMTAYAMTGDKEKFLASGMDLYLAKPVDIAALKAVLAQAAGWS
mgnify:CR=1 FL=1